MKSLKNYISEAYSKISTPWMISHYKKYNKIYFNNELPDAKYIDIQYTYNESINGSMLGCQGFHETIYFNRGKTRNGMYIILDGSCHEQTDLLKLKPFIYINNKISMTMDKFEDTLIHEMIHLWTSKDCLWPKQAHGKEFKKKCNEIREMAKEMYGKNYELTTYASDESAYDYTEMLQSRLAEKNTKNIVGMLIEFDPRTLKDPKNSPIYTFCTRNVSKKFVNMLLTQYKSKHPKIYITEGIYEEMCMKCQMLFGTFTSFRYYILSKYNGNDEERKYIYEIMTNTREIISEGRITENYWTERPPKINPKDLKGGLVYMIPADTDLSDFDSKDAIPVPVEHDEDIEKL